MDPGFAHYLKTLERTEWLPRADLVRYQHDLLERLVRHASEQIPFYRERLKCLLARNGKIDLGRWRDVPILTRAQASAQAAAMRATWLPEGYGAIRRSSTSGTTEPPLALAYNRLSSIATNAALTRMTRWFGVDTSRPLAMSRVFTKDPPQFPEGREWRGWSHAHPDSRAYSIDLLLPVEQQLDWLLRRKAPYLMTSSSNAMALAYAATPEQVRELAIEFIFAIAETVLPRQREVVTARFGAPLGAIYSCAEVGYIATQCPISHAYHVVAENVLVEILREDGSPAAPGETGQVVLTGFYNYAMPFIRYAIGDVATAGADRCGCGRSLPLIEQVEGRTRHAFVFEDGTRIWPRTVNFPEIENYVACREFQIAQLDRRTIEFRYVPDGSGRSPDSAGLDAYLRSKLHPSAMIRLVPLAAIPRMQGGKYDPFVSQVID